jgi:3'(2'), 5'-bisphosphate nucleotidase
MQLKNLLIDVLKISEKAGKEILDVYESNFAVEHKEDKSPLTEADKRSHTIIQNSLEKISDFPILSEEGRDIPYSERKNWEYFWMIDPLDGTKEFIKRNGEFTVNIALIYKNKPVLGVVYAPVLKTFYFGADGIGAYQLTGKNLDFFQNFDEIFQNSNRLPIEYKREKKVVVASRSHMSEETENFIEKIKEKYGEIEIQSIGSSLKLCLVAEGNADFYPRLAPTMEWDTAAAHAVVNNAGGRVVEFKNVSKIEDLNNLPELKYNKENLLNPWFVVYRTV